MSVIQTTVYLDRWLTYDRNIADSCWISKGCDYALLFYDLPSGGVSSNVLASFDSGFNQGFAIGDPSVTISANAIVFECICFHANDESIFYPATITVSPNGVIKAALDKTITDQMIPGDNYLFRLNASYQGSKLRLMNVKTVCRL